MLVKFHHVMPYSSLKNYQCLACEVSLLQHSLLFHRCMKTLLPLSVCMGCEAAYTCMSTLIHHAIVYTNYPYAHYLGSIHGRGLAQTLSWSDLSLLFIRFKFGVKGAFNVWIYDVTIFYHTQHGHRIQIYAL